jgi:hypothetical protein
MDYIPTKDSEKIIWNNNLLAKLEAEGADLGLSAEEIVEAQKECEANSNAILANDKAQKAARTARTAKDTQLRTGEKVLRETARRVKTGKKYTQAIGKSWGIIGDDPVVDYSTYHPKIKALVMPGRVRIDFVKDKLSGVNIYSRLSGELTWVKLAYDSYTPYSDSRPLATPGVPEHREYMAIGVIRDEEVTQQSSIIEAIFGG